MRFSRRQFIVAAGLGLLGTGCRRAPVPGTPTPSTATRRTNWAGNFQFSTVDYREPVTEEELLEIVGNADSVKCVGKAHSFTRIADTEGTLVSLANMKKILGIDRQAKTVTFQPGIAYGELCPELHKHGLAVPNLPSLPHVTPAGAVATATHGSGIGLGNLATSVRGVKLVTADGKLLTMTRESHPADFDGVPVHLGALGLISEMTLEVVDQFDMQQFVYLDLPLNALRGNGLREVMSAGYSVSLFGDWTNGSFSEVWVKRKVEGKPSEAVANFFGATPADRQVHPILGRDASPCSPQLGKVRPSYELLPHFLWGMPPSSAGDELHAEFFVPFDHGYAALEALFGIADVIRPVLQISEVRAIAGDNLWLSTAYGTGPRLAIHSTWIKDVEKVTRVLPVIERTLAPFDVRFHWGKLSTMSRETLEQRYPKMGDFRALATKLDPKGKFRNAYLKQFIFPAA